MLLDLDQHTQLLAVLLLLVLCLFTVEYCRRDATAGRQTEQELLFDGKSALHSVASNMGSVFSLTYFFGGAIIYGFYFGAKYLLATGAILVISLFVLWRLIAQIGAQPTSAPKRSNALLDSLHSRLSGRNFRSLVRLYVIVYSLLLVEELAVSRLVITKLLPGHPAVPALALALITLVIYAYLVLGGFRAVLNSDLIQMAVIGAFLLSMVFLLVKTRSTNILGQLTTDSNTNPIRDASSFVLAIIFGVAWFGASVDFFSRLNFTSTPTLPIIRQRQVFAAVSLILTFVVIAVGITYGIHFRTVTPSISSPSTYTEMAVAHFLSQRPAIAVLFIGAIFCMVFTTLDTLFLTVLQLGFYSTAKIITRARAAQLLLLAVVASCFVEFDAVSAFGIFVGSLMILPAIGVGAAFFPELARFCPTNLQTLEWALLIAGVLFYFLFDRVETRFDQHYWLPAIVLASAVLAIAAEKLRGRGVAL